MGKTERVVELAVARGSVKVRLDELTGLDGLTGPYELAGLDG